VEPRKVDDFTWELPIGFADGMRVPGRVFATQGLMDKAVSDRAVDQVANVAMLPGVVGASLGMPDIHWGYGFPVGGVAATDPAADGVISPGGVGFDIGCGVRLIRTSLAFESDVEPKLAELVDAVARRVPRGVGGKGYTPVSPSEVDDVSRLGVGFVLGRGAGWEEDAEYTENRGRLPDPRPEELSERAKQRGAPQLGSLGAGNHFLEIQVVDEVRDTEAAAAMGLNEGQVCVMIHTGSRGIGHQACTDHVKRIDGVMRQIGIDVPDRQLACAPIEHPAAQSYLGAMDAAGNFAKANRQVLTHAAREAFAAFFKGSAHDLQMSVVYDISHNLAKFEEHEIDGVARTVCVHRKGATRAFGPGHPELPDKYEGIGQPVAVPGSMGTPSYILVGRESPVAFASTCHGAGREMSRTKAKKMMSGEVLRRRLDAEGIVVAASRGSLLAEEAPYAYKDPAVVVETCEGAGLSKVVARLRPAGVIKG